MAHLPRTGATPRPRRLAGGVVAAAISLGAGGGASLLALGTVGAPPAGATSRAQVTIEGPITRIISTVERAPSFKIKVGHNVFLVKCNATTDVTLNGVRSLVSSLHVGYTATVKGHLEMHTISATSVAAVNGAAAT